MMVIALRSFIFFFRFVRNPSTKLNFQFEAFLRRNEIFKSNRSLPTMKIVSRSSDVKTKKRLFTQPPRKLLRVPNVGERGEGGGNHFSIIFFVVIIIAVIVLFLPERTQVGWASSSAPAMIASGRKLFDLDTCQKRPWSERANQRTRKKPLLPCSNVEGLRPSDRSIVRSTRLLCRIGLLAGDETQPLLKSGSSAVAARHLIRASRDSRPRRSRIIRWGTLFFLPVTDNGCGRLFSPF